MNPIIKNRGEYQNRLAELDKDKKCGFCCLKKEFILKVYANWIWIYSEFPYWKYNTILITKKHKVDFTELNDDELVELKLILIETEKVYLDSGIMKNKSSWGMDILWRKRFTMIGHETRSHIHIHLSPHQEGLIVDILDPEAYKIDTSLLKKSIDSISLS